MHYFSLKQLFHYLQLSLILEYCAIGDLRSYLADHSQEFKESISPSNTEKKEPTIENIGKHEKHTLELLTTWSYQVKHK